jgi:hypothetical protein
VQFKGINNTKQGPNTVKKNRVHPYFPTHGKVTILKVIDYRSVKKEEEYIHICFLPLLLLLLSIFLFQESRLMCLSSVKIPVDELVLITGE